MKKSAILFGALLGLVSITANAQTSVPATGLTPAMSSATLNVRLFPVQSIVVNPTTKTVNLDYKTKNDYQNGVSTDVQDHLTVYSTGGFAVGVQTESTTLESAHSEITENILASDILITAKAGTGLSIKDVDYKTGVELSMTAADIITSSKGGVDQKFSVNYTAKGVANNYINKYFSTKEDPTVYTTTVLYSITAQ